MSVNLSSAVVSAAIAAHVVPVAVTSDNRAAVVAWARSQGIKGRVSSDMGIIAENSGATVDLPHNGQIVVDNAGNTYAVNLHGRACTFEAFAAAAEIEPFDIAGVIGADGEEIELSHRTVTDSTKHSEVILTNGDVCEVENVGRGRPSVEAVAKALSVNVWDIASINGYAVVISARLATPRD